MLATESKVGIGDVYNAAAAAGILTGAGRGQIQEGPGPCRYLLACIGMHRPVLRRDVGHDSVAAVVQAGTEGGEVLSLDITSISAKCHEYRHMERQTLSTSSTT